MTMPVLPISAPRAGLPAWDDKVIARFTFRVALFQRRGLAPERAEACADYLAQRDHDRDDRRMCVECAHLQRDGGCFAARQRRIPGVPFFLTPVPDVLQRCEQFEWQKP